MMKAAGNFADSSVTSNFLKAHAFTARWEGGFSDHPADAGGPTNFGISLRLLHEYEHDVNSDGMIDIKDVRGLTDAHAQSLYFILFWQPLCCERLPLPLALTLYDGAVNMGQVRAVRQMQQGMNLCAAPLGQRLAEDGRLGQKTMALAETLDSLHMAGKAAQATAHKRLEYYRTLCTAKPAQKVFLNGWESRCAALVGVLLAMENAPEVK